MDIISNSAPKILHSVLGRWAGLGWCMLAMPLGSTCSASKEKVQDRTKVSNGLTCDGISGALRTARAP